MLADLVRLLRGSATASRTRGLSRTQGANSSLPSELCTQARDPLHGRRRRPRRKGTRFIDIRDAGDPVELAALLRRQGADELVFLDITATSDKRDTVVELARRAADQVFIPFTIGGGVREVADAQAVLDAGADKVSVELGRGRAAGAGRRDGRVFGAQCVVLAIDAKRGADGWEVYVAGGRTPTGATRSPGRARASGAGRGRSCSPRWTATARRTATTPAAGAIAGPSTCRYRLGRRRRAASTWWTACRRAPTPCCAPRSSTTGGTRRAGQGRAGWMPASRFAADHLSETMPSSG